MIRSHKLIDTVTALYQPLVDLLNVDTWARQAAVSRLDVGQPAARFALRRALWQDSDASVRAAAALQLGRCKSVADSPTVVDVASWLGDACADEAPLVREAALRGLARLSNRLPVLSRAELAKQVGSLAHSDLIWWVRRAALLSYAALLSLQAERAIPLLRAMLGDPFWRVRHAAAQALYNIGLRAPSLRDSIVAPAPDLGGAAQAGLWYLRSRFQPSIDVYSFSATQPDRTLTNADPAVTTARLRAQTADTLDPHELVSFLADPHEPLRRLALQHLRTVVRKQQQMHGAESREVQTLLHALLPWLETPNLPRAAETTGAFLDALGDPARVLCVEILGRAQPSPGALRWAASYVAHTQSADLLPDLLRHSEHPKATARAAVFAALLSLHPRDALQSTDSPAASEADPRRLVWARALADERSEIRSLALIGIAQSTDETLHALAWQRPLPELLPVARLALVDLAARHQRSDVLARAARDAHPLVRARALRAQLRSEPSLDRSAATAISQRSADLADRDPEIRLALLPAHPDQWLTLLREDPDPLVRRAALRALSSKRARQTLGAQVQAQAGLLASASTDPWLRTHGAALLRADDAPQLRRLLTLSRDGDEAVRAAAADALQDPAIATLLRTWLQDGGAESITPPLNEIERAAAYAWVTLHEGPQALDLLDQACRSVNEPAQVRSLLPSLRFLASNGEELPPDESASALPAPVEAPAASIQRRVLGRTGIAVSPLGLSGAYDPPLSAMYRARQAGVNLFFWEPGYLKLTRFLRRQCQQGPKVRKDLVIVAGSFEGDRIGIEQDVARALRRLRTSYLDVLLLLWVRSPERLSQEALDCLRDLKRRGKIRAFGFSTHQRDLAAAAAQSGDWDVLMLRHSAAHPGAEDRLLPLCAQKQIGVITFSALSYGRLLRPQPVTHESVLGSAAANEMIAQESDRGAHTLPASLDGMGPLPTAAECYRYTLSQVGVSACWSAPRSYSELVENLEVLAAPALPDADCARLRRQGELVHAEDRRFRAFLRKGSDGAPELLAEIRPPEQLPATVSTAEGSSPSYTAWGVDIAPSQQSDPALAAPQGERNEDLGGSLRALLEAGAPLEDPALPPHEVLTDPLDFDGEVRTVWTAEDIAEPGRSKDAARGSDTATARAPWMWSNAWPTWPLRSLLSRRRKPEKM